MIELTCEHCGNTFEGRPNRRTCSVRCRRALEDRRRFWDQKFAYVWHCRRQVTWGREIGLTDKQRRAWQKKADDLEKKLLKAYGPRP
jgi:hypothetical protein